MTEVKELKDCVDSIKSGDSVFFPPPLIIKGGTALFLGKSNVLAHFRGGMFTFCEHDPYFGDKPRMLAPSMIREDQQVILSSSN